MSGKRSFNKRNKLHCSKCTKTFSGQKYLDQHLKLVHNNNNNIIIINNNKKNNNDKKIYKNKNLLKKFITFIMKLIITINEEIEIRNYIGDRLERKKAIYNMTNDVPNKEFIKKLQIIEEGPEDITDQYIDELVKDDPKTFSGEWGSDIDKKVAEFRRIEKIKKINEKKKEEKENKKYEDIFNYLNELDNGIKKEENKYENIKIKRNIITSLKDQRKEKVIRKVKNKIEEKIEENEEKEESDVKIELGVKEQPIIDYEADFCYPKISARELFIKSFPDKKMKNFAIFYINKKYDDAPTDDEIKEAGNPIYDHYTRVLSSNGFYAKKWDELRNKILEYYENGGESFRCEYCKKYVSCKRRHCLYCKEFLNAIGNDPKQLILKKYLEKNYKKIKIQEINLILKHFEGKNSEFIKKNLPHYIKFQRQIRIKWIKKQDKRREIAEKLGVEVSQLPPVHFNTGLAKKLFREITNFTDEKK